MRSVKEAIEFWSSHYENLENYIDERFNDMKSLVDSAIAIAQNIDSKYTTILNVVNQINSKITEDSIDRLNNLGTIDDFSFGLFDGLQGNEYGTSHP